MTAIAQGRNVVRFVWWDDAVAHAHWLAPRLGARLRVYREHGRMTWTVRVAPVEAGSHSTSSFTAQVATAGWMRNEVLDQDLCPSCAQPRVGFFIDKRLL